MEYAFFDYEEPALFFSGDYLCILIFVCCPCLYLIQNIKTKEKE